jgi:hypothetical protein
MIRRRRNKVTNAATILNEEESIYSEDALISKLDALCPEEWIDGSSDESDSTEKNLVDSDSSEVDLVDCGITEMDPDNNITFENCTRLTSITCSYKKRAICVSIRLILVLTMMFLTCGWFAMTATGQGLVVYLNIPAYLWFDFSSPTQPQRLIGFPGLPDTRNLYLQSTDNVSIGVWHTTRPSSHRRKAVLYLHGNGEHRGVRVGLVKHEMYYTSLVDATDIVFMDYRGTIVIMSKCRRNSYVQRMTLHFRQHHHIVNK